MELTIKLDISELLDKSKEIDLAKILEYYQQLQDGKEIKLFKNMITIQKTGNKK